MDTRRGWVVFFSLFLFWGVLILRGLAVLQLFLCLSHLESEPVHFHLVVGFVFTVGGAFFLRLRDTVTGYYLEIILNLSQGAKRDPLGLPLLKY